MQCSKRTDGEKKQGGEGGEEEESCGQAADTSCTLASYSRHALFVLNLG